MSKRILVLGSSNVDLILRILRFHRPGETIAGENLVTAFGGKGANQAIAAKRLGGNVLLVTKLGMDSFGKNYRRYLIQNGLDPVFLFNDRKNPTGVALIELNLKGENRIIVSPGANGSLSKEDLTKVGSTWKGVRVFVTQLEVPLMTVRYGLESARHHGALTLLNPSPAVAFSPEFLSLVDFLVPNESEARFLTGSHKSRQGDIRKMAHRLLEMGTKNVVITLGSKGLFFKSRDEEIRMKAFHVNALDTTAAGDAFMGALAFGLCKGKPIREILHLANGAGALAATRLGAQPSLPRRKELESFLGQAI